MTCLFTRTDFDLHHKLKLATKLMSTIYFFPTYYDVIDIMYMYMYIVGMEVMVEVMYRCRHGKQLFLLLCLPAAGSYISTCSVRAHTYRLTGTDVYSKFEKDVRVHPKSTS